MGRGSIAVVDIGSNTVRTCVYGIKKSKPYIDKIVDVSKAIGLAGYIDETGAMSKEGIDAGSRATLKMIRVAEMADSKNIVVFATGAVRNCTNTAQVVKALSKKAGYSVRVLSGEEEAFMSTVGASWSTGVKSGLFFDLGGGSTELTLMNKGRIAQVDSIPMGGLSSWRSGSSALLPNAKEIEAIENRFTQFMRASHVQSSAQSSVVAVGGSMRLALKVVANLENGTVGRTLTLADLDNILQKGVCDPNGLCRIVLKLKPERVHTFLPACAIARAIMLNANCGEMTVSKAGLREGCILSELNACFRQTLQGIDIA